MGKRKMLNRVPWSIVSVALYNWSTLLCFEMLYRFVGFQFLFPQLRYLLSTLPGLCAGNTHGSGRPPRRSWFCTGKHRSCS